MAYHNKKGLGRKIFSVVRFIAVVGGLLAVGFLIGFQYYKRFKVPPVTILKTI